MKAILNVGFTGTGKTQETIALCNKVNLQKIIYDPNSEYKGKVNNAIFIQSGSGVAFTEYCFKNFAKKDASKCIVFEEATTIFEHKNKNELIMDLLVKKRHHNNLLIFNFHSLRGVPLYILDYTSEIILRYTNDSLDFVQKKFGDYFKGSIVEGFEWIQENPNIVKANNKEYNITKIHIQITP